MKIGDKCWSRWIERLLKKEKEEKSGSRIVFVKGKTFVELSVDWEGKIPDNEFIENLAPKVSDKL